MKPKKIISDIKKKSRNAELIVVTKLQSLTAIKEVYNIGERNFGENKVQDLIKKRDMLPNDVKWHMIGHLQTNKVKMIAPFIHMIQSVDSLKLIKEINKQAEKNRRIINCLIQIKIAKEPTKFGFGLKEATQFLNSDLQEKYPNINIAGIMGMASFTENQNQIEEEFRLIARLHKTLPKKQSILSIGMSRDYKLAIRLGSNMIRIGSRIFKHYSLDK